MSRFTRNRKQIRKKQEAEQKIKDEHSAQFDKAMNAHIEVIRIIKDKYPGFNNMKPENALKLYWKIYDKVRKL